MPVVINLTIPPKRRAFTLIELLVVVTIIVILAAMGFSIGVNAIKKARMLHDKNTATGLAVSIGQYFDDHGHYPEVGPVKGDTVTKTDSTLMNIIQNVGPGGSHPQNLKGIPYFAGDPARGTSVSNAYRGLFYTGSTSVDLFDAWKKRPPADRRFYVAMDTDYDGKLFDPFDSGMIIHGIPVLVWSTGKDGTYVSTGGARAPENQDNSYSW